MKIQTVPIGFERYRAAVRGAGLVALLGLGAGFMQQANAGCLDVPGIKIPTADLRDPGSSFGSAKFTRVDFRQASEESVVPAFYFQAPIVGLWGFNYTSEGNMSTLGIPDGAPIDNGVTSWSADGNEITFSGARNPIVGATCLGVWKRTGEFTYVLNHIGLSWNPLAVPVSPPNAPGPAGPGNPGGGPGAPGGPGFIKQYITLSQDGQSYSGTFTINQLMPDGVTPALPALIKGKITATRITIDTDTLAP